MQGTFASCSFHLICPSIYLRGWQATAPQPNPLLSRHFYCNRDMSIIYSCFALLQSLTVITQILELTKSKVFGTRLFTERNYHPLTLIFHTYKKATWCFSKDKVHSFRKTNSVNYCHIGMSYMVCF